MPTSTMLRRYSIWCHSRTESQAAFGDHDLRLVVGNRIQEPSHLALNALALEPHGCSEPEWPTNGINSMAFNSNPDIPVLFVS